MYMRYKRRLSQKTCRLTGSNDFFEGERFVVPQRTVRAVAIPALGRQLRVEVGNAQLLRLNCSTTHPQSPFRQSPLHAAPFCDRTRRHII
jgi:hypothetical protein